MPLSDYQKKLNELLFHLNDSSPMGRGNAWIEAWDRLHGRAGAGVVRGGGGGGSALDAARAGAAGRDAERWKSRAFSLQTGMTPEGFDQAIRLKDIYGTDEKGNLPAPPERPQPGGSFQPAQFMDAVKDPEGAAANPFGFNKTFDVGSVIGRRPGEEESGVGFTPRAQGLMRHYKEFQDMYGRGAREKTAVLEKQKAYYDAQTAAANARATAAAGKTQKDQAAEELKRLKAQEDQLVTALKSAADEDAGNEVNKKLLLVRGEMDVLQGLDPMNRLAGNPRPGKSIGDTWIGRWAEGDQEEWDRKYGEFMNRFGARGGSAAAPAAGKYSAEQLAMRRKLGL